MSLSTSVQVLRGATGATMTGGSLTTFVNDGKGQNGKKVLVDSSVSDPSLRGKVITDVTIGAVQPNGNAKLHRTAVTVHQPFVASNGAVYPLPDNLNMSYHPEQTAAEREAKLWNTVSAFVDAELVKIQQLLIND
jgi:hypothetical protein